MESDIDAKQTNWELKQLAINNAKSRSQREKWGLHATLFSFTILFIVVILLYQGVRMEIVATIAASGLGGIWLMGWKEGQLLYLQILEEELDKLMKEKEEAPIDEQVRKAMRDMLR